MGKRKTYQHWDRESIIAELRRLSVSGGGLTSTTLRRDHEYLASACRKYIGSIQEAFEAAGLEYRLQRSAHAWTQAKVIKELKKLHREGMKMNPKAVRIVNYSLVIAASNYFGSFGQALKAAGLQLERDRSTHKRKWTEERIINEIRTVYDRGGSLRHTDIVREYSALSSPAIRRFGSWRAAVEAAGIDYSKVTSR